MILYFWINNCVRLWYNSQNIHKYIQVKKYCFFFSWKFVFAYSLQIICSYKSIIIILFLYIFLIDRFKNQLYKLVFLATQERVVYQKYIKRTKEWFTSAKILIRKIVKRKYKFIHNKNQSTENIKNKNFFLIRHVTILVNNMQCQWLCLVVLAVLLLIVFASSLENTQEFIIKGLERCPQGTRRVGNICRPVVQPN